MRTELGAHLTCRVHGIHLGAVIVMTHCDEHHNACNGDKRPAASVEHLSNDAPEDVA